MTGRERDPVDALVERARHTDDFDRQTTEAILALAARLEAAERENESERIFVAEMSGLINDMGDVPDPGLDDLPGMARVIRDRIDELDRRLAHAEDRGDLLVYRSEWKQKQDALEAAERRLSVARVALERICSYTNTPASVGACVSIARDGLRALRAEDTPDA